MRISAPAVSAAAVALACVAGCASSSSQPAAGSSPGASSTASASLASDPLKNWSADKITNTAIDDLKAASSLHMQGAGVDAGQRVTLNMTLEGAHCKGAIGLGGQGTVKLIRLGNTVWFKPDDKFWKSAMGSNGSATALSLVSGKWVKTSVKRNGFGDLVTLCAPKTFVTQSMGNSSASGMVKGKTTTFEGQPAIILTEPGDHARAYVSETTTPELLQIMVPGQVQIDFSSYNVPVAIKPPPASQTLDGAKFGI